MIAPVVRVQELRSFRSLFEQHYAMIRGVCRGFPHLGVAIFAVGAYCGQFRGSLCVAAKPDSFSSVIVGRHDRADLFLDADPSLSLRHLAVILGPAGDDDEPRLRIIDLRTRVGFFDEHGQPQDSLEADGSLFLRCASHALFFLLTGEQEVWPEHADEAWARLPPRVMLAPGQAEPEVLPTGRSNNDVTMDARAGWSRGAGESTIVRPILGPLSRRNCMLAPDEEPLGELWVVASGELQSLVVGELALRRGVLLGRYDRCDVDRDGVSRMVSRVHLMILTLDDQVIAVDTASSYGSIVKGHSQDFRTMSLGAGQELSLAGGHIYVRWNPA